MNQRGDRRGRTWRRDVRVLYWYWPSPPKTIQHAGYDAAQYNIVMNVAKWTNVLHVIEPVNQKKKDDKRRARITIFRVGVRGEKTEVRPRVHFQMAGKQSNQTRTVPMYSNTVRADKYSTLGWSAEKEFHFIFPQPASILNKKECTADQGRVKFCGAQSLL